MIYISEAHADDEWPISLRIKINQHKTIEERLIAAERFMKYRSGCEFQVFVDSIEKSESFEERYSSWPERGYIIHKNKLEYVSYADVNSRMLLYDEFKIWLAKYNITHHDI